MRRPVAIVSKQRIVGATNGSSAYVLAIARSLADAGFAVHLVQPSPDVFGRTPVMRVLPEMAVFERHVIRATLRFGSVLLVLSPVIWMAAFVGILRRILRRVGFSGNWTIDKPRPYSVATSWSAADLAFVERELPRDSASVIADYIFCVPAFDHAPQGAARGLIMHDLFHARGGGEQDSVASVSRAEEIRLLGAAEAVLAIQEEERNFVETNVAHTRALLVPMPAELCSSPQPGLDDTVLFVGSNTAPNNVGLEWFLSKVWPTVLGRRPNCTLQVAGTVSRAFEGRVIAGVRFLGLVPDLAPLYRDAGVIISPLTFGSGLKIKLVEALAAAKAIIATPTTLQGVEELCGDAVVCTQDPDEFAEMLARLSADGAARELMARRALICAERNFSSEKVHRGLVDWLKAGQSNLASPAAVAAG